MDNRSQFKGVYLQNWMYATLGGFFRTYNGPISFWQPTSRMAEPSSQTITKDGLRVFLEIKAPC